MSVGGLFIEARIGGAFSLKDKRRVVRSIKDKLRQRFNVSVAEVGDNDMVNFLKLGISCVANSDGVIERTLDGALRFIESHYDVEVVNVERVMI